MIQALAGLILLGLTLANYMWLIDTQQTWLSMIAQIVLVIVALLNVLSYTGPKTTLNYDTWTPMWNFRRGIQMIALIGTFVVLVVIIMYAMGRIETL